MSPTASKEPEEQKEGPRAKEENIKVFLRFRPMNKLEISKRSKDCIELHDDPKLVTIDSPLQGIYDFTFDHVFDEYASQEEVFQESLIQVAPRLLQGIHCAVVCYGQTGTGKTHTMMGAGRGIEMNVLSQTRRRPQRSNKTNTSDDSNKNEDSKQEDPPPPTSATPSDPSQSNETEFNPEVAKGMIPRVVDHIFRLVNEFPDTVQCTVRCSYLELYLEKFIDLLQPTREAIQLASSSGGSRTNGDAFLVGAAELCCLEPVDVYALLARGNAHRTKSATEQNLDSSRSHAIFVLTVERVDKSQTEHLYQTSRLYMLDLAGSELGKTKSSRTVDSPLALEGRMVNASLQSFYNIVRTTLADQGKEKLGRMNPNQYSAISKLSKLLKPCLGTNCFVNILCTASPASFNIGETLNTVRFGQKIRLVTNTVTPAHPVMTIEACQSKLATAECQVKNLSNFVKLLAQECRTVRKTGKIRQPHSVWDVISRIAKSTDQFFDGIQFEVNIKTKADVAEEEKESEEAVASSSSTDPATMEKRMKGLLAGREKAENAMRDYKSELATLRTEKELQKKERSRLENELREAKEEVGRLQTQKGDLEYALRTSRFREDESVLFLRQFRSFYLRLLKSKALHGSGEAGAIVKDIATDIPGAPDLSDLLDIDRLMVQSGVLEPCEVGEDSHETDYTPSETAQTNSAEQAKKAYETEIKLAKSALEDIATSDTRAGSKRLEPPSITAYRQSLIESPAGKLAKQQALSLENELVELTAKMVGLQNSVNAEKAMVEALSARQGALGKMKAAQEMAALKAELDLKTNDLQAVVWRMNELHLVNKTMGDKVEKTENHALYLEHILEENQTNNRRLLLERQEVEKRCREENHDLRSQLDGFHIELWQHGGSKTETPQRWKLVLPCTGKPIDLHSGDKQERRISLGDLANEGIEVLGIPERYAMVDSSTQTDAAELVEITIQTDEQARMHSLPIEISTQTEEHSRLHALPVEISTQTEEHSRMHALPVEISTQTDENSRMHALPVEISTQTDEQARMNALPVEISIQTDEQSRMHTLPVEMSTQTDEQSRIHALPIEMSTQTDEVITDVVDVEIQTDPVEEEEKPEIIHADVSVQTDSPEGKEVAVEAKPEASDVYIQTEDIIEKSTPSVETAETSMQTDPLPSVESTTISTQTDADSVATEPPPPSIEMLDEYTQTDVVDPTKCREIGTQTDGVVENKQADGMPEDTQTGGMSEDTQTGGILEDTQNDAIPEDTQTDDVPEELGLTKSKSFGSEDSILVNEGKEEDVKLRIDDHNRVPPKPTTSSNSLSVAEATKETENVQLEDSISIVHDSNSNLNNSFTLDTDSPLPGSRKNSPRPGRHKSAPKQHLEERLGSSMSALPGISSMGGERYSKMRTHAASTRELGRFDNIPSRPPLSLGASHGVLSYTAEESPQSGGGVKADDIRSLLPARSRPQKNATVAKPKSNSYFGGMKPTPATPKPSVPASKSFSLSQSSLGSPKPPGKGGQPEWMLRAKDKGKSPAPGDSKKTGANELMERFKARTKKDEVGNSPAPPEKTGESELMQRLQARIKKDEAIEEAQKEVVVEEVEETPESELMRRLQQRKMKDEAILAAKKEAEAPKEEVVVEDEKPNQPEWMKRFKEIGMKGEEKVIEAIKSPPPVVVPEEPEKPDPNTPEFMLKFKKMGKRRDEKANQAGKRK